MKIYVIEHCYDVDGGFGDAIPTRMSICAFKTKEQAEVFVSKNSNPHVYGHPYDDLYCGELEIEELDVYEDGSKLKFEAHSGDWGDVYYSLTSE